MTEETIDYQALYEGLQKELEQARITILKMRQTRSPLDRVNGDSIRTFVQKNYLVLIISMMLVSLIVTSLKTLKDLWGKHEG